MGMSHLFRSLTIVAAAVLLSACATMAVINSASSEIFQREDVNLKEKNFAAADFLFQQVHTFIARGDTIKARPLRDAQEQGVSSEMGRMIAEDVGQRYLQLGYRVDLSSVNQFDTAAASALPPKGEADFILIGEYMRGRRLFDVTLKMVETSSGNTIGTFSYSMPMSTQIGRLSKPKAVIIRTTQ